MAYDPDQFAEKYKLALESARKEKPAGGLSGFELEWNLLDENFRPLLTTGSGSDRQSFVDYLDAEIMPPWVSDFFQLEVFHWMIEFATRPYYQPRGAIYEARLLEAVLMNALARAGAQSHQRLHHWHGNLPYKTPVSRESIPGNWGIAKRRYLERCVDLYGDKLAVAGTHSNLSLPDPLFMWDFMHLPAREREKYGHSGAVPRHLDDFKSEFYITAARLLRAFASLYIATSASTPLQATERGGRAVLIITENDSNRNLTFPNPPEIDRPDLYRSYNDYLRISYDLVQRGVRFGNNNWTPVRARSFAEPVERLISTTSDQLTNLYARGLYSNGEASPAEEMAREIEKQNLMARINLPMGRVEVRTDDDGDSLDSDVANLTFKSLLLLRFYADPDFARTFRYDREDIDRARRNEAEAARNGLRAEIENPLTGKPVPMRQFLKWTLDELKPLAAALGQWEDLTPLVDMAGGAPNAAEKLRARLRMELGAGDEVPQSLLKELSAEREAQVAVDVEKIAARASELDSDSAKIFEMLHNAREEAREHPELPIRFRPVNHVTIDTTYPDKTSEILDLAQHLIRFPSVTACPNERLDEVHLAGTFVFEYLHEYGFAPRYFDGKYPAVFAEFPARNEKDRQDANILLTGHFDVVQPEPDDSQFTPRVDGDYLWGRGAADMKTVVATYLVWMKDALKSGKPFPNVSLLLVGNEENGETEAWGTPQVLAELGLKPALLVAGERTGENGNDLFGEICIENRGVMRFDVIARGTKGHTGVAGAGDLSEKLIAARAALNEIFARHLTLKSKDGWQSQAKFPFINVGTPGVYNVTAAQGILGVEIRPIPDDNTSAMRKEIEAYCAGQGLEASFTVMEDGVACDRDNPALVKLIGAVKQASGSEPKIGRKLPGTSARFAPGGQAVVWGQSGLGPHAKDERHYIPSIEPYYRSLVELGKLAA